MLKPKGKKKRKKAVFAKESATCRAKRETRIKKQAKAKKVKEMLEGVPTACDIGGKKRQQCVRLLVAMIQVSL